MNKFILLLCLLYTTGLTAQITANFTAQECTKELYKQGFDSENEMSGWTITPTNTTHTWHLDNSKKAGIPNFSSISPTSLFSMAVFYDKANQNEILTSPETTILPNSSCTFYACFDGVYVMWGNFTIEILEAESQLKTKIFDAFAWSQENGHERPKWLPFNIDLSNYANKKVQFIFTYKGSEGDDVLIDDFRIIQKTDDETSSAEINEGNSVHFEDLSGGNPTTWEWTFEGGTPSASTEQNPVIIYNSAGIYPVKLTAGNSKENSTQVRNNFVIVKAVAPVAKFNFPRGGYLSPYAGYYVPVHADIQFIDISLNRPTNWLWNLPGSSQPESPEQSPIVFYPQEGAFDISLQVSNKAGTDLLEYKEVIQAGGTQHIWNIETNESSEIAAIPLGWYGYYGGTNWLGMDAFAEIFDKPAVKGNITEVSVFFDKATTITPDTVVTLSIAKSEKGLPGTKIASASISAGKLISNPDEWLPTDFKFKEPVEITDSFFVVIEGIPNRSTDDGTDDIAIAATTTRPDGGKSTVYHLLQEWDENDRPTGKTEWIKNSSEFLSFAIAPKFSFDNKGSNIPTIDAGNKQFAYLIVPEKKLYIQEAGKIQQISVWTVTGSQVYTTAHVSEYIDISSWNQGTYILKAIGEKTRLIQKIILK